MVQLDIGEFKSGARSVSHDLVASDIALDSRDFERIHVAMEMDREGDRLQVKLEVSATAHLICDRTSEPFDLDVQGSHTVLFLPHDRVGQVAEVSTADPSVEILGFEPSDPVLDVTTPVRDTLFLSIPTRRLAPGASTAEIPLSFGSPGETDIDPRWEGLRVLRDQSSQDS
jgi:uncharacterized metal-binding protein YceD (DUF177 family)